MLLNLCSGLKVEARRITGVEAIAMAEKAKSTKVDGNAIARLLSACTERVVDPGPYPWLDVDATGVDWMGVLSGDLIHGLIQLRCGSVRAKDRYVFRVECRACDEPFAWQVPLLQLPVTKLPDDSTEHLRARKPFEVEIESINGGKLAVTFELPTSKNDDPMRQLLKTLARKKITSVEKVAIAVRSINGKAMPPKLRHDFFSAQPIDDTNEILAKIVAADAGVDTRIYPRCQDCGGRQAIDLPFAESFFNPQEGERRDVLGLPEEEPLEGEETKAKTGTSPTPRGESPAPS